MSDFLNVIRLNAAKNFFIGIFQMRTRAATQVQTYNQIAIALGGIVTLIGLVVMIAWHFHLTALVQLLPGAAPMRYNTALTFLLSGLAITNRK